MFGSPRELLFFAIFMLVASALCDLIAKKAVPYGDNPGLVRRIMRTIAFVAVMLAMAVVFAVLAPHKW